ncbi:hydroxymethylglutaryl-CoA lyase [Natronorubrum texcoconense]|uniref:Hydroxymethylglutaryl-CoA lyase n=1 Tax=Natronorubrum texcoconense TaxID=1095776 RepID=A0A1G9D229_9EURY|nr:hydroxymethylglutaryl-CoA lyase [Natronorubrum texcoconense]SDK57853.1 hydroxymethylglutaryl-CoA lyase [Natronorubrum texcoconense]
MDLSLPESATIVEMLPRDGFQRYPEFIPTDEKVELIDALSTTGVDEIEFTSFTHPKAVPSLRDAAEVAERIERRDDVCYRALVPNTVGMERAIDADVDKVNALVVISDGYREKNQGMSLEENLEQVEAIVDLADGTDIEVEAGLGTSFFCPYDGEIDAEQTLSVVDRVLEAGVDEVTLATTMGMADPRQVTERLSAVYDRHPDADVGLHLHDTNGMSLANTLAAMQCGVSRFDTSVCGLGGGTILPGGLGDVGNTPTEDLVNMLHDMGVRTNVDEERLLEVATNVADRLDLGTPSRALMGGTREQVLETAETEPSRKK